MSFSKNFVSEEKGQFNTSLFGFLPKEIKVPFDLGKYIKGNPVVNVGDVVTEGCIISTSKNGLNIHSSIPGTVTEICNMETSDGLQCMGAKIALHGSFSFLGKAENKKDWKLTLPMSLRKEFDAKGVINTFNTLSREKTLSEEIEKNLLRKRNPIVCVRLFDDDPSRVTESYASEKYWSEVLEGAAIICKASNAIGIIFAKDSNSKFDFNIDERNANNFFAPLFNPANIKFLELDGEKYPSGLKNQITKTAEKLFKNDSQSKSENKKSLPKLNHKDLFVDSLTCLSVYRAIVLDQPHISNLVHLTGSCIRASSVMNVRLGTTIRDLAEQSGGFRQKLEAIVINGVVRGSSVDSLDIPVTKYVKSISFLSKHEISSSESTVCIRCGNCRRICPVGLEPDSIFRLFLQSGLKNITTDATIQSALLCSECALCNTACASRLPLSQTISIIKNKLKLGELSE